MFAPILDLFRKPSAKVLAQHELEDAQRSLLDLQHKKEYYESMVACTCRRIERLKQYVNKED